MAKSNILGYLFAVLLGLVLGGFIIRSCSSLPDGKIIVNKSAIDSLNAFIAFTDSIENLSMEPVVIETDTVYIEVTKYTTTLPIIEHDPDSNITYIKDSLIVKDEISVWIDIETRGNIKSFKTNWKYNPIIKEIETVTEIPVYKPVIQTITEKVTEYPAGHYLSLAVGGNSKMFNFGVDYSIVKKDYLYGLEYRRYGDQNVYGVKVGVNLRTLFKKNR